MKTVSAVFLLVFACLALLSVFGTAVDAVPAAATYKVALTPENQTRLAALLETDVGLCSTDTAIRGYVNTSNNGIVIMVLTAEDQTLEQWTDELCAKALLRNNWATRLTLPSGSTDEALQQECLPSGVATCGTTDQSLCPCSASQTSIFVADMAKQPQIAALRATGGACNGLANVVSPLNTQQGIFIVVNSNPGQTMWDFERTACGVALLANSNTSYSNPAVVDPIINECYEHGDHGHCGSTPQSTCPCSVSQNLIYNIVGDANIQQFATLRATGGKCAGTATSTNPSRTIIFGSLLTEVGLQLYVRTTAGRTQWDFETTPCGIEINTIKDSVKVGDAAQTVVDKCWEHGDHAHCGPAECPCKKPASLNITPVVFKMNMTHVSLEGAVYFNNYFIRSVRRDPDCGFARNLPTYADGLAFSLRIYIDAFKSTCTVEKMNALTVTSFQAYWAESLVRWEGKGGDPGEDDSHAGHEHFEVLAVKIPAVPGVVAISVEAPISLNVDTCWNSSTDGLKCLAENAACPLLCPLGAHCHKNSECGTGSCAAEEDEHDHDDDHHGHSHNVVRPTISENFISELNIEPIDIALALSTLADDDDHHHHDELSCRLINAASVPMTITISVLVFVLALILA